MKWGKRVFFWTNEGKIKEINLKKDNRRKIKISNEK